MKIFITGGCKNGKSTFAQELAKQQQRGPLYYIATMVAADNEDSERIIRHRKEREGWGFITIEQPRRIEDILGTCDPGGSFLLDSLTALLANEMFPHSGFDENAAPRTAGGLAQILSGIGDIVIVSDYIYSDAILYDSLTEQYRKGLARLDCLAAVRCDVVLEASFGQITAHKGGKAFGDAFC